MIKKLYYGAVFLNAWKINVEAKCKLWEELL